MESSDPNYSEIILAHGVLYDRKVIRKQGKNKNVQKLHKPLCGNTARIKLCWQQDSSKSQEKTDLAPPSYHTNSEKEKLALWHAENFRQQIGLEFPFRAPPLLAAVNECGVQKLVCSFVRPSAPPYPALTEWQGIAKFVSDHLTYRPLTTPTQHDDAQGGESHNTAKYTVRTRKQFASRYLASVRAEEERKIQEELEKQREDERRRIEEEERLPVDPLHGRRVHCWVLVLPGPARKDVDSPFYLEPASGNVFSIEDEEHMGVESVWNHLNFWFNVRSSNSSEIDFNLDNINSWIPLLQNDNKLSRSLDMPISWMEKIEISGEAYKTRYPGGSKTILYKRARLELFAELSRDDGLVCRVTQFSDLDWTHAQHVTSEYKHRQDLLTKTTLDVNLQHIVDYYTEGREDHIKEHGYSLSEDTDDRTIHFYHSSHPEGLSCLRVQPSSVLEKYKGHSEYLKQRHMRFKQDADNQIVVEETVEDLLATEDIPCHKQVAQRKFFHFDNKIFLKFHHATDQITAGYLHFIKPNEDGKFGVEHVHEYEPLEHIQRNQEADVKNLIQIQMEAEKQVINHAKLIHSEIQMLLDALKKDRDNPGLKTSVFDEERNHEMVQMMQLREQELLEEAMKELVEPVDPIAPLLERAGSDEYVTPSQLDELKLTCEEDIKFTTIQLQNNLQEEINQIKLKLKNCQDQQCSGQDLEDREQDLKLKIQALEYRLGRINA